MPCWKKFRCLLLTVCLLCSSALHAEGIVLQKAEVRVSEDSYQLAAEYHINLSFAVEQALSRGVSIYLVCEFNVTRSRWYWFDEQLAKSQQTFKLSYNLLARQYRVTRGSLYQNFPSLEEALQFIQRQSSAAISYSTLGKDGNYLASTRFRLDVNQLPKPLQVNALTNKDWELDSGSYRWVLRPDEILARHNGESGH